MLNTCEKWNIFCHISKQRMSQTPAITATTEGEPEETQEGNEYLPPSSHQTATTASWGILRKLRIENTGN